MPLGFISDYGQPNDPFGDTASLGRGRYRRPTGAWNNPLDDESLAVSPDVEAAFRGAGIQPGDRVVLQTEDGTPVVRRWDDRTADDATAARIGLSPLRGRFDFFSPSGAHPMRDRRIVAFQRFDGQAPVQGNPQLPTGTAATASAAQPVGDIFDATPDIFDAAPDIFDATGTSDEQPSSNPIVDFLRRIPAAASETGLGAAAGISRFFQENPAVTKIGQVVGLANPLTTLPSLFTPSQEQYGQAADIFSSGGQSAHEFYGVDPARNEETASKVAEGLGGVTAYLPTIASGPAALPLMATQAFGGTKEADYQRAIEQGQTPEQAGGQSTGSAATKTALTLPLYMLGSHLAGKLGGNLAERIIAQTAANAAGSATARGIDAAVEGKPIGEAITNYTIPNIVQDVAFGAHGALGAPRRGTTGQKAFATAQQPDIFDTAPEPPPIPKEAAKPTQPNASSIQSTEPVGQQPSGPPSTRGRRSEGVEPGNQGQEPSGAPASEEGRGGSVAQTPSEGAKPAAVRETVPEGKPPAIKGPAIASDAQTFAKGELGQSHAEIKKPVVGDIIAAEHDPFDDSLHRFVDEKGNVLTREDAWKAAKANGQLNEEGLRKEKPGVTPKLESQDLIKPEPQKGAEPPNEKANAEKGQQGRETLLKPKIETPPAEPIGAEAVPKREAKEVMSPEEVAQRFPSQQPSAEPPPLPLAEEQKADLRYQGRESDIPKGETLPLGPGKMTEGELPPQKTTGLKREVVDTERLSRGLPEIPTVERQREEGVVREAEDRLDADPSVATALVDRINNTPGRAITEQEAATLLVERQRLHNIKTRAEETAADPEATAEEQRAANANWLDAEARMNELDHAQRVAGSTWGRLGHMYQRMIREDFTLEALQRRARALKGGSPLTPEENAKLVEQAEQIKVLQERVEREQAARTAAEEQAALKSTYERQLRETEAELKKRPQFGKEVFDIAQGVVNRWKTEADAARKSLRERLGQTSAGLDPAILVDVAKIMRAKVGEFGLDYARTSAAMIAEFGEKIQPYLQKAWVKAQGLIDKEKTAPKVKEAIKEGTAKPTEKAPVDLKARAKAESTAGLPLSHKLVYDLGKQHIEAGVRGEDAVAKAIHKDVIEFYPDATERDVRRAYVDYGKEVAPPNPEDVATHQRLIGRLFKVQEDIDRLNEGLGTWKSQKREKAVLELREKIAERAELLKKVKAPPTEDELASRDQARQTQARNAIEALDKELRTGEEKLKREPAEPSPQLEQLKSELQAMRDLKGEMEQQARDAQRTPETEAQQALNEAAVARERVEQRLNDISEGKIDVTKPEAKEPLTQLEEDMRLETEALRQMADEMARDIRKAARPRGDPEAVREKRQYEALRKAIERYDDRLASGRLSEPNKKRFGPDPQRVAALKDIRDSRLEALDAARRAGRPIESAADRYNRLRLRAVAKQLLTAKERIAKGDFERPTKRIPLEKSPTLLRAEAQLHGVKRQVEAGMRELEAKRRPWYKKAGGLLGEARGIILGSDVGVLARQGLFSWARPITAGKAAIEATKAAFSPEAMDRWEVTLRDREINGELAAPKRKAAGLQTTDTLTHPEELVITRLLSRLPDVKIGGQTIRLSNLGRTLERFQTTFINAVRTELFDAGIRRGLSPEELKTRANFINSATGRSNVKHVPRWMNVIFTSPRYEVSRWETIGQPLRNIGVLAKRGVRGNLDRGALANLQDMAVTAAGIYALYKVAQVAGGYQVNWNPQSADFLKMRKDNDVWDVSAGIAPRLRDLVRLFVAFTHPDYHQNIGSTILNAGLRTVNPAIKTPVEQGSMLGQRLRGEKPKLPFSGFLAPDEQQGLITMAPLIFQSMQQALKEDGVGGAAWAGAREFVGTSVQRYPEKKTDAPITRAPASRAPRASASPRGVGSALRHSSGR